MVRVKGPARLPTSQTANIVVDLSAHIKPTETPELRKADALPERPPSFKNWDAPTDRTDRTATPDKDPGKDLSAGAEDACSDTKENSQDSKDAVSTEKQHTPDAKGKKDATKGERGSKSLSDTKAPALLRVTVDKSSALAARPCKAQGDTYVKAVLQRVDGRQEDFISTAQPNHANPEAETFEFQGDLEDESEEATVRLEVWEKKPDGDCVLEQVSVPLSQVQAADSTKPAETASLVTATEAGDQSSITYRVEMAPASIPIRTPSKGVDSPTNKAAEKPDELESKRLLHEIQELSALELHDDTTNESDDSDDSDLEILAMACQLQRPHTADPTLVSTKQQVEPQGPLPLPAEMIERLTNLEPVEYLGVLFIPKEDAEGNFSIRRSLVLETVDDEGSSVVEHVLADTSCDGRMDSLVPLPSTHSLEAVCLLATQFKAKTVSAASHKVQLRLQCRVAEECIKKGDVTCFVPLSSKAKATHKQANATSVLRKRSALTARDPRIIAVLTEWFAALPRSQRKELEKKDYVETACLMMRRMLPDEADTSILELTAVAEFAQAAEEEWADDSSGRRAISYQMFEDCMVELADLWCEGMSPQDYEGFFRGLYKTAVVDNHGKGKGTTPLGRWFAMKAVLAAPRTMAAACEGEEDARDGAEHDNEELAAQMCKDVFKEISRRRDTGNEKVTVVEIRAFLSGTCFGPFCEWMLRDDLKNWKRFEEEERGDGRLDRAELQEAMQTFLTVDGFGREVQRSVVDTPNPDRRRATQRSSPDKRAQHPRLSPDRRGLQHSRGSPTRMGQTASPDRRAVSHARAASAMGVRRTPPGSRRRSLDSQPTTPKPEKLRDPGNQPAARDPRMAPRHAQSVSPCFSRKYGPGPRARARPPGAGMPAAGTSQQPPEDAQWWLHMKTLRKCYSTLVQAAPAGPPPEAHYRKSAIMLTQEEVETAKSVFGKFDRDDTDMIEASQMVHALEILLRGMSGSEIRRQATELLKEHGCAYTSSLHRKMDFEEFVSIYNALNLNQTDFSNADFF